jgi:hypothetical protein
MNKKKKLSRREFLKSGGMPCALALAAPVSTMSLPLAEAADLAHTMWVHGHSAQIQNPDEVSVGRFGWGARAFLRGTVGVNTWFQFAIPTPVIVNGEQLRVGSVMVAYRTTPSSFAIPVILQSVHVYDGGRRIATHDGLNMVAPQGRSEQFNVPQHPRISSGLGVSVGVFFAGPTPPGERTIRMSDEPGWIEFHAVGCHFLL